MTGVRYLTAARFPNRRARVRAFWNAIVLGYDGELCFRCGGRVAAGIGSWWHADDALFERVAACSGYNILCPFCFEALAAAQGIVVYWQAREPGSSSLMGLTTDPRDPRLGDGVDDEPVPQHDVYLVLSDEERAKGFVRPYRDEYRHLPCGTVTRMGRALSETYARQPDFYGATYCVHCCKHLPVSEFVWTVDGQTVGA